MVRHLAPIGCSMIIKDSIRFVLGSTLTYFIVAACAATKSDDGNIAANLAGADSTTAGTSPTDGSGNTSSGGSTKTAGGGSGSTSSTGGSTKTAGGGSGNTSSTGGSTKTTGGGSGSTNSGGSVLDPVPDAYASTSGTRLKPMYRTGSDGSKEYLPGQWWDSARNEGCSPSIGPMSDGTIRCVPSAISTSYFSDAACTQSIGQVSSGCSAPKYAYTVVTNLNSCSTSTFFSSVRYFSVGAPYTGAVYSGSGTTCTKASSYVTDTYSFYTLGTELPPSTFVAFTTSHD